MACAAKVDASKYNMPLCLVANAKDLKVRAPLRCCRGRQSRRGRRDGKAAGRAGCTTGRRSGAARPWEGPSRPCVWSSTHACARMCVCVRVCVEAAPVPTPLVRGRGASRAGGLAGRGASRVGRGASRAATAAQCAMLGAVATAVGGDCRWAGIVNERGDRV